MTIFGFNSNVQRDDVTYHVESQARQSDLLLQTMIFVKGQCVGKHVFSYAAMTLDPGFSEEAMHGLLKAQHKNMIDALQRGPIASMLVSPSEVPDVAGSGLAIKWTNPADEARDNQIVLKLQVLDSGSPVVGASVSVRPDPSGDGRVLAQSSSDSSGAVALAVPVTGADSAVIAQARHGAKSATRKLRLKN
jgi:hypothetical protein